jgi:hypothetical protein
VSIDNPPLSNVWLTAAEAAAYLKVKSRNTVALGAPGQSESLRSLRHQTPCSHPPCLLKGRQGVKSTATFTRVRPIR